jgi:hypothetical protein
MVFVAADPNSRDYLPCMPENPFFGAFLQQTVAQHGSRGDISNVVYHPSHETTVGVGFQCYCGSNHRGSELNSFGDSGLSIDSAGRFK